MAATHSQVGVVILNWRRPQDTLSCLASLERVTDVALDTVVVNNAPRDGLAETIRARFPHTTVIENGANLGFAAGCNIGMRHLLRRGASHLLLHNDDAEVAPDTPGILVDAAESDSRIGMVGPTIFYARRPTVVWSAGGKVDWLGRSSHRYADGAVPRDLPALCEVEYASGCVLLVTRSVVERVGPLDERFFAYFEETEWCARARRAGFRVAYVPHARAWHQIEPATRGESPAYLYLMARNRLLYLRATGAPTVVVACAVADILRTAASWSCRRRHRARRRYAGLLRRAVLDFARGRFGPPPPDL